MAELTLSVLDQSPVPAGASATEVLRHTIELAQLAERLGYHRYWLAEHHGSHGLLGSAPEVLIAHVAAQTSSIRVGSGGVMLSHYSPYKVAEQFHLLEALHPGRIDLGVGRAPGGEQLASLALQRDRTRPLGDDFLDQISELTTWLRGTFAADHPFARLAPAPLPAGPPPVWMLSSSGFSAAVAAEVGAGLCFAHFINELGGPAAIELYRTRLATSHPEIAPETAVAVGVVCAETDEEAEALIRGTELWRLRSHRYGDQVQIPSPEEAEAYDFSDSDRAFIDQWRRRIVVGGPERVHEQLAKLAVDYGTDEIVIVTVLYDPVARRRSYELLAEAFGLCPAGA